MCMSVSCSLFSSCLSHYANWVKWLSVYFFLLHNSTVCKQKSYTHTFFTTVVNGMSDQQPALACEELPEKTVDKITQRHLAHRPLQNSTCVTAKQTRTLQGTFSHGYAPTLREQTNRYNTNVLKTQTTLVTMFSSIPIMDTFWVQLL